MPAHAAHSSYTQNHITDGAADQHLELKTEQQLMENQSEGDKDPVTPFTLISSLAIGYSLYVLPALLKQVRRIIKIPIYKQIDYYRI